MQQPPAGLRPLAQREQPRQNLGGVLHVQGGAELIGKERHRFSPAQTPIQRIAEHRVARRLPSVAERQPQRHRGGRPGENGALPVHLQARIHARGCRRILFPIRRVLSIEYEIGREEDQTERRRAQPLRCAGVDALGAFRISLAVRRTRHRRGVDDAVGPLSLEQAGPRRGIL